MRKYALVESDLKALLPAIVEVARRAGDAILDIYRAPFDVLQKDDASPVTAADLAANRIIIDRLRALTPGVPILSEECAVTSFDERRAWETLWIVDPLDGTREFIKRNGEFTVNIALVQQGVPVLGVVYAPALGDVYSAIRGVGAFHQSTTLPAIRIRTRVSSDPPITAVVSRSHADRALDGSLALLAEQFGNVHKVSAGSSLKFCLVAEGLADIYLRPGPTSEWDTAAAQCVVEAAGGRVLKWGEVTPLTYNKPDLPNPWFMAVSSALAMPLLEGLLRGFGEIIAEAS